MTKAAFPLLVPCLFILVAFSGTPKESTIGVYDPDSVYAAMPRYQQALAACAKRDSGYKANLDTFRMRRAHRAAELEENAATDSPLMHGLRIRELVEMDTNIVYFIQVAKEDSINYRNGIMQPVYTVTRVTAEYLRKEQKYMAVLKKNELDSFRTVNPGKYTIVNLTGEMITRTK